MKFHLIFFLFIASFSSHLTAMNCSPSSQSSGQVVELIETINNAINQECDSDGVTDLLSSSQLSQSTMVNVFAVLYRHCSDEKKMNQLSQPLSETNLLYTHALRYFTSIALKNMLAVTDQTIHKIENLTFLQPEKAFDGLSPAIKKFIMHNASKQMNFNYTIVLTGHTDEIVSFDICAATGHAVTASKDNTIRLWNLNKGEKEKCIHTQHVNNPISVCFNTTGSHIATLELSTKTIRQWKIQENALTATHSVLIQNETPLSISYLNHNTMNTLLLKTVKENNQTMQEQYFDSVFLFNEHNSTPINLGSTEQPFHVILCKKSCITKEPYFAAQEPSQNILSINKKKCLALLLCEQAVKNSGSESIQDLPRRIKRSLSYKSLNECEQNMIETQIQNKKTLIREKNNEV